MRCFALLVVPALLGLCYAGVNDDQGGAANQGAAYQPNNQGGSSQGFDAGQVNRVQPQIVPMGGDSGGEEGNVVSMTGHIPAQSGGAGGAGGSFGAIPPQTGAAGQGAAGGSSNSFDTGAGYAGAGVNMGGSSGAAGADAGLVMQHQDLKGSSSGMSGAAVAGVVAGVVVIGAVGTAIAVVALKAKA